MGWLRRNSGKVLLVSLILHFIASPILDEAPESAIVEGLFFLVLIAALNAEPGRLSWRNPLTIAVAVAIASRLVGGFANSVPTYIGGSIYGAVLFFWFCWVIVRDITKGKRVTAETIAGAAAVYILLAVAFTSLYHAVGLYDNDAFNGIAVDPEKREEDNARFYYFSIVTQTTLGYGDISPRSDTARGVVMAQVVIGQLYLAILLARLVAMELAQRRARDDE